MHSKTLYPALRWDIFCRVIDNFGDLGVCWRLARQLVAEHGCMVRLWVDDLLSFARLCPEVQPTLLQQRCDGENLLSPDALPAATSGSKYAAGRAM